MQSRCTRRNLSPTPNFLILSSIRRETPGSGVIIFAGLVDHTAESIKSLEGYRYAWVEEAQTITARSLELLLPTIRVPTAKFGSRGTRGARVMRWTRCFALCPAQTIR